MTVKPAALLLHGAVAGYGGVDVLRGLDLEVRAGEVFVLAGPNGAGKSTAARAACGLIRLRSGTCEIGGVDAGLSRGARRRVALAPQEPALFPALTVRENVQLAANLSVLTRPERAAAVVRALDAVDGQSAADLTVRTLSGGWRRRASLAVALVGDPLLLVLDEPTEGVDDHSRLKIAEAVRACAARGAGVLLVSHDGGFIDLVADRIGVLTAGKLRGETGRDALLAQAFGQGHLVTVRLDRPAEPGVAAKLREAGLTSTSLAMEWRGLSEDPASRAAALSSLVDAVGGEIAVRRPTLGDLAAQVAESPE